MFDESELNIEQFKGDVVSSWRLAENGSQLLVQFETNIEGSPRDWEKWDCQLADDGTYAVTLSADSKTLTLAVLSDQCNDRAAILVGDWTRWPCPNPASTCQTELSAGWHAAASFRPEASDRPLYYTVPAGWSNSIDSRNIFSLERRNDPGSVGMTLYSDVAAHSQSANCQDIAEPGIGYASDDIVPWLRELPELVVGSATPIVLMQRGGLMVDVALDPTLTSNCMYPDDPPAAFTFTNRIPVTGDDQARGLQLTRTVVEGNERVRYIFLTLYDIEVLPNNMLIEVRAPDEASMNDFWQSAMPILETLSIHPKP